VATGRLEGVMTLPPRVSEETKKSNGSDDDSDVGDQIQTFHRARSPNNIFGQNFPVNAAMRSHIDDAEKPNRYG